MGEEKEFTIIAVDDQLTVLYMIVSILKQLYQVKPFSSAQAALRYLENETADLILLDYIMPGISGSEMFERLRLQPKTRGIPVMFLTGFDRQDAEVELLEMGAVDYIRKPVQEKILLARVRMQVELARYRNHMEKLIDDNIKKIRLRENVTLSLLARATDMRDHETGGHIERTTEIVRVMVNDLLHNPTPGYTLTVNEAENIVESAKLHDLGKIAIPDNILLKPGKLEPEEFMVIQKHPLHGASMLDEYITQLGNDSFLNTARDIALYHHEKWDGTGYPHGLKGKQIPLAARITAIADVYDALNSERPYKVPMEHSQAVKVIVNDSGISFDPALVAVFLRHESEFEKVVLTMS